LHVVILAIIYLFFFLSGAAALIYEVVWVRSLSLVFGGSHLAVTTVLSVFMGGLALGSYLIGKRVGSHKKLLRLYGMLELGIAAFALLFVLLLKLYPWIYVPLAQIAVTSPLYLSFLRVTFAFIVLIGPTTLMGGTLPVLSSLISTRAKTVGAHLSFLYGFNTLGAVTGVTAAGFVFLPNHSVGTTLTIAVLINVIVGILAISLQNKVQEVLHGAQREEELTTETDTPDIGLSEPEHLFSLKLVLWGIGVSGFCALGYEVLWTRILSIVIGASVYGFALILMAFLAGIGLGSAAYGLLLRMSAALRKATKTYPIRSIIAFGLVQVIIGLSALVVTLHIRDLPAHSVFLHDFFQSINFKIGHFRTRQLANFILAFSFVFVPAFFMGVAFPLAGKIHAQYKSIVGSAVGEILAYNTIGAILGSAVSGFVLIYLFGIQRSLQMLILINIGFGLLVMVSVWGRKMLNWAIAGAVSIAILVLAFNPGIWAIWDTKFYAIYQSNIPGLYSTPEKIREALENNDVLYSAEGVQAIVSSIRAGERQYFITNGRVEASNSGEGMQVQYALGHLPMLLNKNPKKVFVLGTGSGMTLGATSVHPSVEQITLAEIEPKVLGVARTFGIYNHYVMDNPKVKIVFNDGRNFLMTTKEKFDVVTADPIHPWFSGAGYLYTAEYFKLAAQHLNPGGIVCQWLPIYELTDENLKSVVKTFRENFAHTVVWLTHNDAVLIGSNSPIIIDEEELERRIRVPQVLQDLQRVKMGSAEDFLSYFVMGNEGAKAYSSGGIINTDDNLYLEFSAPRSVGKAHLMGTNLSDVIKYRESILPYLLTPADEVGQARQKARWAENLNAAVLYDKAHVLNLMGRYDTPEYEKLATELQARYPAYAPWRFLREEIHDEAGGEPHLLKQVELNIINAKGEVTRLQFSAVILRRSKEKARVFFVDSNSRVVFGKLRVRGANRDAYIGSFVDDVMKSVLEVYNQEQKTAVASGAEYPTAASVLPKIKNMVELKVEQGTK
jgi:spermidine synthase